MVCLINAADQAWHNAARKWNRCISNDFVDIVVYERRNTLS